MILSETKRRSSGIRINDVCPRHADAVALVRLALLQMRQGDEGWLLMPSRMAWGISGDTFVGVPPVSTIAYWLKVVEHKPKN